jgi:hypothetical protein
MRRSHADKEMNLSLFFEVLVAGGVKPIDTAGSAFGGRSCAVRRYPAGPIRRIYGAWES